MECKHFVARTLLSPPVVATLQWCPATHRTTVDEHRRTASSTIDEHISWCERRLGGACGLSTRSSTKANNGKGFPRSPESIIDERSRPNAATSTEHRGLVVHSVARCRTVAVARVQRVVDRRHGARKKSRKFFRNCPAERRRSTMRHEIDLPMNSLHHPPPAERRDGMMTLIDDSAETSMRRHPPREV